MSNPVKCLSMWFALAVALACSAREPAPVAAPARPRMPELTTPWQEVRPEAAPNVVNLRVIAFNDFHGNLRPLQVDGRPLGGARALAAHVRRAQVGYEQRALLVHAGDQVGASPPESGLLQDEPSIEFLNLLADTYCQLPARDDPRCNVVGTLGNHEFDEGVPELLRLLRGGDFEKGPRSAQAYAGARFPYVSANVLDRVSQAPLLPPYVVRDVGGIRVGVIGAVLASASRLLNPASPGLSEVEFAPEVDVINRAAEQLLARGVTVIVLTIHQGLEQAYYGGPTRSDVTASGDLSPILAGLHDEIDVVVSGHTHEFTNAFVRNASGREVLVVQSLSAGRALATVDLSVEATTGEVLRKSAEVNMTYGDEAPGNEAQPDVEALVVSAMARVSATTERVVGKANVAFPREFTDAGECVLGSVVADAQRRAVKADLALTNPGGIRKGLDAGTVTWGQLFAVQPFGNQLALVSLTGSEIRAVLERQWSEQESPRFLQISGFRYEWDAGAPVGKRVVSLQTPNGTALAAERTYRVVVNSYLANGGDGFGLAAAPHQTLMQTDLDALVDHFGAHPRGIDPPAIGRIRRRN